MSEMDLYSRCWMRLLTFIGGGGSSESPGIYTEEHQIVPTLQSRATVTIVGELRNRPCLLGGGGYNEPLLGSSAPMDAWKTLDPEGLIVARPPKVYGLSLIHI